MEHESDLTVDLGFAPKPISVGNLVFADVNGNGTFSTVNDFGIPGVLLQLHALGDVPGSSTPLAQTYTKSDGTYELRAPGAGDYFLHVPATQFASGGPLAGAGVVAGSGTDDGTDDNANEDTLNAASPATTGVNSIIFNLAYGTEPAGAQEGGFGGTRDDAQDADKDMTVDLGFTGVAPPQNLGLGNLVFADGNNNGRYDSGEGVSGVWVLLYRGTDSPGTSTPFASTSTDSAGRYTFTNLRPGGYTVHVAADNFKQNVNIPALAGQTGELMGNGPLYHRISMTGAQSTASSLDDHLGEDGIDSANPTLAGVSSGVIILQPGACPTGAAEGGFDGAADNAVDANYNLTVDFGFVAVSGVTAPQDLGIGNLVFADADRNGLYSAGEGVSSVIMELYRDTDIAGLSTPLLTTTTDSAGRYLFSNLASGSYKVHVAAQNFQAAVGGVAGNNGPLYNKLSITGAQSPGAAADDHLGEDGVDSATPLLTGVTSGTIVLAPGTAPSGGVEAGFDGTSDDALDADYNLTVDFGFVAPAVGTPPQNLGIGNLVFLDANGNGRYNSGEGVSGVQMRLYRGTDVVGTATPLQSTTTDSAGRYLFSNLTAGAYKVHVTGQNFQTALLGILGNNGPLYNKVSVSGAQSTSTSVDDNLGEDGIDAANPLTAGVTSGVITLAAGSAPAGSAESGFEGTSDDAMDADYNLTIDFGFVASGDLLGGFGLSARETATLAAPVTGFAAWQAAHPGIGAAGDDPDLDGSSNLLEYALAADPASGLQGAPHFQLVADAATGRVDALLIRPSANRDDVVYHLEALTGLRDAAWTRLLLAPAVTQNNDGTETVRFADVAATPAFATASHGFLRIKVLLDTAQDGTADATAASAPQAWLRRDFTDQQSFSQPLLTPDVFLGAVTTSNATTLTLAAPAMGLPAALKPDAALYVEVLTGALEGRRYEVDEAATTDEVIALESSVSGSLAGARIALRTHWTVDACFGAGAFQAGTTSGDADRLLFFDRASGAYKVSWLGADGWTGDSDGARLIPPGEGLLVHARGAAVTLTFTGAVRTNRFHQPLAAGAQLVGAGFPVPHSTATLGLTQAQGFKPGATPATADRLRLWNADTTPGAQGYESLYLLQTAEDGRWVIEGDVSLADQAARTLIEPGRALFIVPQAALPARTEEVP